MVIQQHSHGVYPCLPPQTQCRNTYIASPVDAAWKRNTVPQRGRDRTRGDMDCLLILKVPGWMKSLPASVLTAPSLSDFWWEAVHSLPWSHWGAGTAPFFSHPPPWLTGPQRWDESLRQSLPCLRRRSRQPRGALKMQRSISPLEAGKLRRLVSYANVGNCSRSLSLVQQKPQNLQGREENDTHRSLLGSSTHVNAWPVGGGAFYYFMVGNGSRH